MIGLIGGGCVLAVTAVTSHQHLAALFNLPGLVMVLGGTLAATVISRPLGDVARVFKSLRTLLHDEKLDVDTEVNQLLDVAHWYRAGRIDAADQAVERVTNPLLRDGARLVIDRQPLDDVVKVMQWRVAAERDRDQGDAHILRTMGTFAPAFGMLGTLFGLIQMLGNLGQADLPQIGATMGFALITTLYGLVFANLMFKPLAIKMERRLQARLMLMNVILEGVVLLHQRRHPTMIKEALDTYVLRVATQSTADLAKAA